MSDSESEIPGLSISDGLIEGVKYTSNGRSRADDDKNLDSADIDNDQQIEFVVKDGSTLKKKHFLGVYTVENAVEAIGFGPFQILVTIFTGLIWLSDAMEVMLLAVLSPIVKCDWDLAPWQQAMLTSIVFLGFFFGGLSWGFMTDAVGRRMTLLIIDGIIFVFGLISAASPSYGWLLFFRFIAGFGIGGSSQAVTYYVEFLPLRMRGVCIVLQEVWWAIGSILAAALALLVIPNISDPLNWRLYLCLCAIPIGAVMVFFLFMPESARYYVSKGKIEKGEKVIRRIAWLNGKKPPAGRLVSQEEKERLEMEADLLAEDTTLEDNKEGEGEEEEVNNDLSIKRLEVSEEEEEPLLVADDDSAPLSQSPLPQHAGSITTHNKNSLERFQKRAVLAFQQFGIDIVMLFKNKSWQTTIPLLFIWLGCAWLYYGAVLLTTTILENDYDPRCGSANESDDLTRCRNLTASFYVQIVWTSAAEFPGIIVTLIIIELIGRKITMALEFIGTGLSIGMLLICVPQVYLGLFLFSARGFATGVFQAVYVYTPEVYPTRYRGSAMGLMTSSARIGALITPFIAQQLYHVNDILTVLLYVSSCIVLAILAMLLPIETKGRSLKDVKS